MVKRLLLWLVVGMLPTGLAAQDNTTSGGLTVRSTPPGAVVTLDGDVMVTGVTPTTLQHRLSGSFDVTIKKHLYETYKTSLALEPGRAQSLEVSLSPKTRFKGAIRSALIPGWGQIYSEQKGKGLLFGFLAVGTVTAFLIAEDEFQMRHDRYEASVSAYDAAKDTSDFATLLKLEQQLREDQQDAYDAENVRRVTIGAVAGVWALNLLDILLFFPDRESGVEVYGLNLAPATDQQTLGLTLSRNF